MINKKNGHPLQSRRMITFPIMQHTNMLLPASRENTASSQAVVDRGESTECAQLNGYQFKMSKISNIYLHAWALHDVFTEMR